MSQPTSTHGWRGELLPRRVVLKVGSALLTPEGPLGGEGFKALTAEVKALQV